MLTMKMLKEVGLEMEVADKREFNRSETGLTSQDNHAFELVRVMRLRSANAMSYNELSVEVSKEEWDMYAIGEKFTFTVSH